MNEILPRIFLYKLNTSITWIVKNRLLTRKNCEVKPIRQSQPDNAYTDTFATVKPDSSFEHTRQMLTGE